MSEPSATSNINLRMERARRSLTIYATITTFALIIVLIIAIQTLYLRWGSWSLTYMVAALPFALSALSAGFGAVYGWLNLRAAQECEEQQLLSLRKSTTVFESEDFPAFATQTFRSFRKWGAIALAVTLPALGTLALVALWQDFQTHSEVESVFTAKGTPSELSTLAGTLGFLAFLAAFFSLGQARETGFRWLRTVGNWLMIGAIALFFVVLSGLCAIRLNTSYDPFFFTVITVGIALIIAESTLTLLGDIFRPRGQAEERPIFESRILSILTEPGGGARNLLLAIEYQFGVKLSSSWAINQFYSALLPLLLLTALVWTMLSSIVQISPGEHGFREQFGRKLDSEPLTEGLYFNLPTPFGSLRKIATGEVRYSLIGPQISPSAPLSSIEWTKPHYEEDYIVLVPSRQKLATLEFKDHTNLVPVNLLSIAAPLLWRPSVPHLEDYLYRHANPEATLKAVAESVLTAYFAQVEMQSIMADGRALATTQMTHILQQEVDQLHLGIEIISFGLHDVHPPVQRVAMAFEEVIGAKENMERQVFDARELREGMVIDAQIQALNTISKANSYQTILRKSAQADAERFQKQLQAFLAAPQWYRLDTHLSALEANTSPRLFLLSQALRNQIIEFNFEESARFDLPDISTSALQNK